jgi:type II secretory pathway pseudopilin PulG
VAGYSLVEILVVLVIIVMLVAVGFPNLMGYMRVASLRAAQNEVASELQSARFKAIAKNVRFGVAFVILSSTTYQYVVGDYLGGPADPVPPSLPAPISWLSGQAFQVGPVRTLPQGVTFGTTCANFTANAKAMRFNRLGGWCDPTTTPTWTCPAVDVGTNLIQMSPPAVSPPASTGTTICLRDTRSGLTRQVFIDPGGRVRLDS